MSEKRFTIVGEEYVGYTQGNAYIISNGECKFSLWESKEDAQKVCDCLNEQQATISKQLDQIIELQDKYRILEFNHSRLENRNKAQYEKINKLKSELNDCEKFRYPVFKGMEKIIEDKDNCVLNKDAKSPCKAYDECLKRQGTNKPLPCMVNWMMGRPFENMLQKEEDDE